MSASNSWFAVVNSEAKFDCRRLTGNPFNLRLDTRMIIKCKNSINKLYSIFENTIEVVELAVWSPGGLSLDITNDDDLLQVKKNMKGLTLRAADRQEISATDTEKLTKYLNSLMNELENVGNFTIVVTMRDDILGYRNKSANQWLGLMKVMYEKEADIALVLFSMANSRLKVVDFTIPLMHAHTQLYAKLPNSTVIHWSAYFRVFDKYSWMTLGLTILIVSAALGLTKSELRRPYFTMNMFFGNLINVWGIYTQQGLSECPPNTSTQMLYFWIMISSVVINALYSAIITSYITVLTTFLPFSTYNEFLNSDYKVIVLSGSRDEDLIHENDSLLGPFFSRLRTNVPMPKYADEGFEEACNEKTAFYIDEVSFSGTSQKFSCMLGSVKMPRTEWMSLAMAKDSPYRETIDYYILRLMDHGIVQRLKRKFLYKFEDKNESEPNVVTLWEVMPILSIWFIGVIAAFIVLNLELFMYNFFRLIRLRKRSLRRDNMIRIAR